LSESSKHGFRIPGIAACIGVVLFKFERENAPETVLSQAARQSCEQEQRDVYESHRHRTFSLAFYMTGNEIEAEEILTTTFVRAFEQSPKPDGFAVDSALVTELNARFPLQKEEPSPPVATGGMLGNRNVLRADLEVAVRGLPANERLVFLLRDVEGYQPAAIARLLDITEAKVQRTCFAARIRLAQILAQQTRTEAA